MFDKRVDAWSAKILTVLGPDFFEALVDLGFGVSLTKKFKLGGVDTMSLKAMNEDEVLAATEFLKTKIEGCSVLLRATKRHEHYYTKLYCGPEETNVAEEMFRLGLLKKFEIPVRHE